MKPLPIPFSRLLILGGGGFLGSHLVESLLERTTAQLDVVDLDFSKLDHRRMDDRRIRMWTTSIRGMDHISPLIVRADAVLSLTAICTPAAYNRRPREVIQANFSDLVPVIEACAAAHKHLFHFSTCEVYGRILPGAGDGVVLKEEESPLILGPVHRSRWTYACAKQLLERYVAAHGAEANLPWTIIRPFNVIGPRMDHIPGVDGEGTPRVLACFMDALLRREPLPLVDGGKARRAFIAIEDFVDAVLAILAHAPVCQGEIINVGNPQNDVSIEALAQQMIQIFDHHFLKGGMASITRSISAETFYGPGYDDTPYRIPDIGKILSLTGWAPTVPLEKMLPTIIADYVRRYGPLSRTPQEVLSMRSSTSLPFTPWR